MKTNEEIIVEKIISFAKKDMSKAINLLSQILVSLIEVSAKQSNDVDGEGEDKEIIIKLEKRDITIHKSKC